jgi:hypothetical protein
MLYLVLAAAVAAMLGFMFFRVAFAMRKDRVRSEREATRGQHAFTRNHRARMLLRRAFQLPEDADWQEEAKEHLAAPQTSQRSGER